MTRGKFVPRLFGQDAIFQTIRESFDDIPHLFITGPPGCGKTTFLEDFIQFCKQEAPFQVESVLWLSSEKDRGIHTIRDKVNDFCKRAHSKPNSLRWIVIDDADTLPIISQQALRRPMETFSHLTRFIFASRHANQLSEPSKSRCMMLELEPISPFDAYPLYCKQYDLLPRDDVFQFFVKHFHSINDMKCILLLYKSLLQEQKTPEEAVKALSVLLPDSNKLIQYLIYALSTKNIQYSREVITKLFLKGFLLDDILLGVEKGIALFPSSDPDARFTVLHFTMLGWISIQQGKEHWLDTMDILATVFQKA